MRIAILIEDMTVAAGGPSRVAGVVASGLAGRGHEVTVATLPCDGELVPLDPGVRLMSVAGSVVNPANWLRAVRGIRKLADNNDVIFVSGIWGPVDGLALRLAGISSIPVHIRVCGMLEDYILRRHPSRKWLGRTIYTDRNLSAAASLIVNTPIEAANVERLGLSRSIRVIPNGVVLPDEDERMQRTEALTQLGLALQPDDNVILYLSRIHPKKGLHRLLDTLHSPMANHPDWHLVVAGSFFQGEGYEDLIRAKAAASAGCDRIHFVGEVSGRRKTAAYSLADLFVLPSASEGFSNAVLEAMSWSLPVIITKGCNFPEVAGNEAGWVIDVDTELASALAEAMTDTESLRKRGLRARTVIESGYQQARVLDLYEACARESIAAPLNIRSRLRGSNQSVRKRVVFFVESVAVASGGTSLEATLLASQLARNSPHDIQLVSLLDDRPEFPIDPGVVYTKLSAANSPAGYASNLRALSRILENADVLFSTGIWGPFDGLGMRLAVPDATRFYVRVCGMLQPYILNRNKWKKVPARMLYVNHNLNRADGLIVNSIPERDQVASLGFRSPIHLIRNGIEKPLATIARAEARRRLNIEESARVMLYLGRIHPKKNLHLLVAALADFAAANPGVVPPTLLVGGGSFSEAYDEDVRRQIHRLADPSVVRLLGEVRGEDKEVLFAAADVFILPSQSEGLPNAALESMARRLPVIMTLGCNLPEVEAAGAGLLVEPDKDGLRKALHWLNDPAAGLDDAGVRASALVAKEFGMDKWVEEYLKLIE